MVIYNACIVTQNKSRTIIPKGYIVFDENMISTVQSGDVPFELLCSHEAHDVQGRVVIPGLINTHIHLGETVYQPFLHEGIDLSSYISKTNKIATQCTTVEGKREIVNTYSLMLALKAGTTTICGGRVHDSAIPFFMRNVSGYMLMQSPKLGKFYHNFATNFSAMCNELAIERLSSPAIFLHSLNTVEESKLSEIKCMFETHGTLLIVHVAETFELETAIKQQYDMSSIKLLNQYKLLNERTVLVHGNWIDDVDIALIKKTGAHLVHCLQSNFTVDDSTINYRTIRAIGSHMTVATDGLITNGSFSLLESLRACWMYHNRFAGNNPNILAQQWFDMITVNAAQALGMQSDIGSIEVGKKADLVVLDTVVTQNISTLIYQIVFYTHMQFVSDVLIDGKFLVKQKRLTCFDEQEVIQAFLNVCKKMKN